MNLVDRAKNIIFTPRTEWEVVAGERPDAGGVLTGYAFPMALIPAFASFVGYGFVGFLGTAVGPMAALGYAVLTLVTSLLGVVIASAVVNLLAPTFASEKSFGRAVQLVAYAYTPAWVGGVMHVVPALAWIGGLFGLYGAYLMYLGLPKVMKTPEEKVVVYMVTVFVVALVVSMVVSAILISAGLGGAGWR